jgi:hypothetical protein
MRKMQKTSTRALLVLVALVTLFSVNALATDITVTGLSFPGWQRGGTTARLRAYASDDFTASDGTNVVHGLARGTSSTTSFFRETPCTVTGTTLSCTSIILPSTDDALDNRDVRWSLVLFDSAGRVAYETVADQWPLSVSWGGTVTLGQWRVYANTPQRPAASSGSPNFAQMNAAIAAQVNVGNAAKPFASPTPLGRVALSVAASDPALPIVVGTNDTRVPTQSENDALAGTSGSPSSTNEYVTASDPQVNLLFNPRSYGAVGDGVTNDTTAMLAALAAAGAVHGRFHLPAGDYLINQTLAINKALEMSGDGMGISNIILASTAGSTTDVIGITPPATGSPGPNDMTTAGRDNRGYYLHDFSIMRQSGTPGRNGIRIDTTATGSFLHASSIERVEIGVLGGAPSIYFTNSNTDGIFGVTIEGCHIFDGFYGNLIGDSIHLHDNIFREYTSSNPAVDVSFVTGAANFVMRDNNIYNKYGVRFRNGIMPSIIHNIIEGPEVGFIGSNGAMLDLDGSVAQISGASVRDNTIGVQTPTLGASSVRVGNVAGAVLDNNNLSIQTGNYGIDNTGSAVRAQYRTNSATGPGAANVFKNAETTGTDPQYVPLVYFSAPPAILAGFLGVTNMLPTSLFVGVTNRVTFPSQFPGTQVGGGGVIQGDAVEGVGKNLFLMQNAFYNNVNSIYLGADAASEYNQTGGCHIFRTAPAGLAGGNISWTDRLQVCAAGVSFGGGTSIAKILKSTVSVDPASINAMTVSSQTFTLTGAATGDSLILNPPSAGLTSGLIVMQSFVSAANTITVVFYNTTGAPVDEGSASWTYQLVR